MVEKTKSVGAQLREARQARGWTSKAAAKATKIKEQQLLQIEAEEYSKFAAPAYVRGFVRIYAKTLGLNEVRVLQELDKVLAMEGDDVYLSSSPVQYMPKQTKQVFNFRSVTFFFLAGLAIVIFGILAWYVYAVRSQYLHGTAAKATLAVKSDKIPTAKAVTGDEETAKPALPVNAPDEPAAKAVSVAQAVPADEQVAKAVPVAQPAPPAQAVPAAPAAPAEEKVAKAVPVAQAVAVAPAAPAAPADGAKNLVLQARSECWVRVTQLDGGASRVVSEGVMKAGEERDFPGEKFMVKMADPSAMTVIYNGKSVALGEVKVPTEYPLP